MPREKPQSELITIKEFAIRIMVGETKAREMARDKILCDKGISVNINPDGTMKTLSLW